MQAKAEFRRSERFVHESIFKLEDNLTLSPYRQLLPLKRCRIGGNP